MTVPALVAPVAVPDAAQAGWAGTWWSAQTDEIVQLAWVDGALRQAGSTPPLVPLGGAVFRPQDQAHAWRFSGPNELRIRDFWPTERVFTRVDEPMPDLAPFAGRYHSDETATDYTVRLDGARLMLSWPRGYDIALAPVGGNRFVSARGTVTFTHAANEAVAGLTISNRRLRRFMAARVAALP
jgi:hypothetical protein